MQSGRDETPAEKMDRNWSELLQELRVTQTGVQILSAFLLTLPFQAKFGQLNDAQRGVYLFAVSMSVLATALLIAPVSAHRILFRRHEKDVLVAAADRLAKFGLCALAGAVLGAVTLVFSVVAGTTAAVVADAVAIVVFVVNWVLIPRSLRRRQSSDD